MLGLGYHILPLRAGAQGPLPAFRSTADIPVQDLVAGRAAALDLAPFFAYDLGTIRYAVTPALPAGLSLSGSVIGGVPATGVPSADYVVAATARGGPLDGTVLRAPLRLGVSLPNSAPVGADLVLRYNLPAGPGGGAGNTAPTGLPLTLSYNVEAA